MIGKAMRELWNRPTKIYLRVWPVDRLDNTMLARFRYNKTDGREDLRVTFARQHNQIPMTTTQWKIWDELRTDIALGQRSGDAVWSGMAQINGEWIQEHAFWIIMQDRQPREIIGLHYHRWLVSGRPQPESMTTDYRDWTMAQRNFQDIQA